MSFRKMLVRGADWPDERPSQLLLGLSADLSKALIATEENTLMDVPTRSLKIIKPYFDADEVAWAGQPGDFIKHP